MKLFKPSQVKPFGRQKQNPKSKLISVTQELVQSGIISNDQASNFISRFTKQSNPDQLIEMLHEINIINPVEPLNEDVEDFIQELGAMDAQSLADFILDLRNDKKGLKDMTPVPVKSYFPAAYLAVGGGLIIFAIILSPQLQTSLDQVLNHTSPEGSGFKLPFFGFIDYLKTLFI